jgi:DNA-binding FadR family transcriptional regulator
MLAAERGDREKIATIAAVLDRMRIAVASEDADAYRAVDAEFHFAVFSASGNMLIERLSSILGPLYDATFRAQMQVGGTHSEALARHAAVYEAILAGDPGRAGEAMEQILSRASSEIAAISRRRPEEE